MSVTIALANSAEWDVCHPLAEMEGNKKGGRCLNPGLKFHISGLEDLGTYMVSCFFHRSEEKYKFCKEMHAWVPWKSGNAPFPQQKWTQVNLGCEFNGEVDFSKFTICTNEAKKTQDEEIVVQTQHVYAVSMVIKNTENEQEQYGFMDERVKFIVITNSSPRLVAQKARLCLVNGIETISKEERKENASRKRAAKEAVAEEKKAKRQALEEEERVQREVARTICARTGPIRPRFHLRH